MKRIKLYAYCANNLGDDLMVRILLEKYPDYQFFCDTWRKESNHFCGHSNFENWEKFYQKHGRINHLLNILTLYRKRDFYLNAVKARNERECVCSVYVGGSIYMQERGETVESRLCRETDKLKNGPLFVIGANFGPYITEDFKNAFADYFRKCGGVTFRDKASYELFADNEKVSYAPDVVLNLDVPKNLENHGTVLISVIDVAGREALRQWSDAYDSRIAEICDACLEQGKTPVLMSFCKFEGDEAAIARIVSRMPEEKRAKVRTFFYDGNLEEALELYRTADQVVATRFHAMILALKFGKPVYSISYNQKVKHVMQDMELDCFCNMEDLPKLTGGEMLDACRIGEIKEYERQAEKQFAQFEVYMKGVK